MTLRTHDWADWNSDMLLKIGPKKEITDTSNGAIRTNATRSRKSEKLDRQGWRYERRPSRPHRGCLSLKQLN